MELSLILMAVVIVITMIHHLIMITRLRKDLGRRPQVWNDLISRTDISRPTMLPSWKCSVCQRMEGRHLQKMFEV